MRVEREFTTAPCESTLHQPNCIASLCSTEARFDGNVVNNFFFVYCEEYFTNLLMSPSLENKARVGQLTTIDRKRQLAYFLLTQHKKIQVETKEMSLCFQ